MSAMPMLEETGGESLANEQLSAFLPDPETRLVVQAAIADRWPNATVHDGGLSAALGSLSHDPSPPILIVDISDVDEAETGLRSLLALCDPSTRLFAIGTVNDISYYRRLVALGVTDYIVKPLDPAALITAIDGAQRARPNLRPVSPEKSRSIISVVGARGGIGASTVAVNLAWIAAHEMKQNCAIIDLDLQFGTVALQLDLEPSHGLREALENPDRIDSLFIASAMASESENLFVLSAEEPLDDRVRFSANACKALIDALPDQLTRVIIDVPARSVVENPDILATSDKIVLVSDPSLVGMRDTVRLARLCREAGQDAELCVVLNRTGMARKGEIPKAEFVKGVDLPVDHLVPFSAPLAAQAANAGKPFPLIEKRSQTVSALRRLAEALCDVEEDKKTGGGVARLFAPKKKKS